MAILEIENLSAFYGKAQALDGVSFSVEEGEIVGVIGAFIGGFLLNKLGVSIGGGVMGQIGTSVIGAMVLLFVVSLIKK